MSDERTIPEEDRQAAEQASQDFEANLEQLEEIVQKLEDGNLPLDQSLKLYEQGVRAYRLCQKTLSEAELEVRKLVETVEGELDEEPFEPPA